MFLIAKIVRGRRLLQELEAEAEKKATERAVVAETTATTLRRSGMGSRTVEVGQSEAGPSNATSTHTTSMSPTCRKAVRQKTDTSLPEEVEADLSISDFTMSTHLRRSSSMPSVSDAIITPVLKHYDYDSKLNRLQKRFLRFTWHRLQTRNGGKRVGNVFEEVYERLLKQLPGTWEMFTTRTFLSAMSRSETATPRDHAKETVKLIDHAIKNLEASRQERDDTGSDYDPFLIGKAHGRLRPYGFTGNYWEKLGEIIVDVVLVQEAVRDLPGAGQAWVIFTACLVDQLRAGFDESKSGLMPITGVFAQKFTCNATVGPNNSNTASDYRQHNFVPSDITCCSSVNRYYTGQAMLPECASTVGSKECRSPGHDSDVLEKSGGRNYPMSVTEYENPTFRSRRKGSVRLTESRTYSKGTEFNCEAVV